MTKKISVKDLKEMSKLTSEIIKVNLGEFEVEIKPYISILDKVKMISGICESGVSIDDGFYKINYTAIEIAYKVTLVKEYTNINLPKNPIEAYDLIVNTGIYKTVLDNINQEELKEFKSIFRKCLKNKENEQAQQNGSLSVIKDILLNFSSTIPNVEDINNLLKLTVKDVNSLDKDNLTYINDFMKVNSGGVVDGESNNI